MRSSKTPQRRNAILERIGTAIVTDFTAMSEVCGAGWRIGYDRVWTPMRAWQAWPDSGRSSRASRRATRSPKPSAANSPPRARDHALRYDADRVLEEHWLPALAEIEQRLADRRR